MKTIKTIGILICFSTFLADIGWTQVHHYKWDHYTIQDGLSHPSVRAITQDRQGFIWIATSDGLNRFDGYEFKVFTSMEGDSTRISNNNIHDLLEDQYGYLWIATLRGGLNVYDPVKDRFASFQHDPDDSTSLRSNEIVSLLEDKDGIIWVGTSRGLHKVIRKEDRLDGISFQPFYKDSTSYEGYFRTVFDFVEDDYGYFWLGTSAGLIRMNKEKESFQNYHFIPDSFSKPLSAIVTAMHKDESGGIWLASHLKGLQKIIFHPGANPADPIPYFQPISMPETNGSLGNRTSCLTVDSTQTLWVGTYDGLRAFPVDSVPESPEKIAIHVHDPDDPKSLAQNTVSTLFCDRAGNLWVATKHGLSKRNAHQKSFKALDNRSAKDDSVPQHIQTIGRAKNGKLWLGTPEGPFLYHQGSGIYEGFSQNPQNTNSPVGNQVTHFYSRNANGPTWMTAFKGISRIDELPSGEVKFTNYTYNLHITNDLSSNRVFHLLEDEQGDIWLGAYFGLLQLPKDGRELIGHSFGRANNFIDLIEKNRDTLWLGSQLGMYLFDKKNHVFTKFPLVTKTGHEFEGPVIKVLLKASDGTLWIGSRRGLIKLSPNETQVMVYGQKDGLPNMVVSNLLEDSHGNIWLTTNSGLSKFDPIEETFRNYTELDGLPTNLFQSRSAISNEIGEFLFCSEKGVVIFHPDSLTNNPYRPPVAITSLRLFNEPVEVNRTDPKVTAHNFSIPESPSFLDELSLSYQERVISFQFAGLDFTQPNKNQYAYRLKGFDKDWRFTDASRRFAVYTNLDPGSYTFEVKASNNDGVWNETAASLRVNVSPPWWKTSWAYLFYVGLAIVGVYFLIRFRTAKVRRELEMQSRIKEAKVEERERVRARSSRDFHDEAGNKITKIALYTGLMKQKVGNDGEMQTYLEKVEAHVKELSGGMRDFIWVLDPKQDTVTATLMRIRQFGESLFEHTDVSFAYQDDLPNDSEWLFSLNQKRHLLLICKEAMNNCLKYAQAQTFRMKVESEEGILRLIMSDDGLGFDLDQLVRVNGLNNMRARAEEIGAAINIESVPGMGTSIICELDIHPNG